jgi:hypothetical protein
MKRNSNISKTVADECYVLTIINMQSAFCVFLYGHSLVLTSFLMEKL